MNTLSDYLMWPLRHDGSNADNDAVLIISSEYENVELFLPDWSGRLNHADAIAYLNELEHFVHRARAMVSRTTEKGMK